MERPIDDESLLSVDTPFSQDSDISESERTPLMPNENIGDVEISSMTTSHGSSTNLTDDELNELEKPWPATFERSISLLSGPTFDTKKIDLLTKSPKITPSISKRKEGLNYLTPVSKHLPGAFIAPSGGFKQELRKNQSLDYGGTYGRRQQQVDAKLYRQKLIEEARKKQQYLNPPSIDIPKDKKNKKLKKKVDTHAMNQSDDKASFGQCAFNMANILMGVGMLGLPYIFKSAGWIGGFLVTLSFSSIAWRTSILLGRELNGDPKPLSMFDGDSAGHTRLGKQIKSFPEIAMAAFGPTGNILLSLCLYFELFSCLCIFFVTLGDHLHTLFPSIPVAVHMTHVSFIMAIPTALLRTPKLLSYLSMVGTCATACVVLSVLGSAIYYGDVSEEIANQRGIEVEETHSLWKTSGLPIGFGLIAYTFSGHAIIPSIYTSMARPQDYEKMITYTFLAVTSCCLIVALSGYYMFGSSVDDQITLSLENFSGGGNIMMTTLTWLMILTAFSKFTLTAFPLALGIEEIFAPCIPSDYVMEWVSSLIKLFLIGSSLAVAIFVPSFSLLCSLVGLICTMIVSVIFPAAAHLKLFGAQLPLWEKIIDWFFVISGTCMTIIGTISSV